MPGTLPDVGWAGCGTVDGATGGTVDEVARQEAAEAQAKADAAAATADSAQSDADTAQATADTALTNADNAQTDANQAIVSADQRVLQFATVAQLQAYTGTLLPKTQTQTVGYYAPGDGGGNIFYYDETDTTSEGNGGNVIVDAVGHRYKQVAGEQNAKQWGCKADPVNAPGWDDSTPLQKALDVVKAVAGSTLYIPAGAYHLIASINGTTNAVGYRIRGDGWDKTILRNGEGGFPILDCTGAVGVTLEDFTIRGNLPGTGANIPSCSLLMGRGGNDTGGGPTADANNLTAGSHVLKHVRVWGTFTKCAVLMNSAENCLFEECEFYVGDNTGGPSAAIPTFIASGGSTGRGVTSKYKTLGDGHGGNSCVTFLNCRFHNYSTTGTGDINSAYCLELDGCNSYVLINPYFYSRYISNQVFINNNSTAAFDSLTISAPRHEYLPTGSGGLEPTSYLFVAGKQIKGVRIDNGWLTRIRADDGSIITGLALRDITWKCDPANPNNKAHPLNAATPTANFQPPMIDAWIVSDADHRSINLAITAGGANGASYLQVTSPTFHIRHWSRNCTFDSVQGHIANFQNAPNAIVPARGLFWDGATSNAAVIIPLTGANITTDDFTMYLRLKLPSATSYTGNHRGIAGLSLIANGQASVTSFRILINTSTKQLQVIMYGNPVGNTRTLSIPADFALNSGLEIVDIAAVRKGSDSSMKFYINGLRCTSGSETTGGSGVPWSQTLTGAYWAIGIGDTSTQFWNSNIYAATLVYRALNDSEVAGLSRGQTVDSSAVMPDLGIGLSAHIPDRGDRLFHGTLNSGVGHLMRPNRPGYRSGSASPAASVLPAYLGEDYLDTTAKHWWKAVGLLNTDWKQITV